MSFASIEENLILSAPPAVWPVEDINDVPLRYAVGREPARQEGTSDVSWMEGLEVGNSQGRNNSCSMQTIAAWLQAVHDKRLRDEEIAEVFVTYKRTQPSSKSGMSFPGAWNLAKDAGWLKGLDRTYDGIIMTNMIESIQRQPIMAGINVRRNWNNLGPHGKISTYEGAVTAKHGVLFVARGRYKDENEIRTFGENSWGYKWGANGMFSISEGVRHMDVLEMWVWV